MRNSLQTKNQEFSILSPLHNVLQRFAKICIMSCRANIGANYWFYPTGIPEEKVSAGFEV